MSKANHYLLNLHHNNPRFTRLYNDKLTYRVAEDKYLLALYDESFYNLYKAGNSKGTYYGTITNSCYNFDGSEFKFLTVYPELGKSTVGYDGAKFALGKITLGVNEKLLLQPTSRGNELLVYNTDTRTKVNVRCAVNVGLPNDFSSDEIQSWNAYGPGEFLIIPQRDITSSQGKRFEKSKYYLLDKSTPLNKIELKEFNTVNDFASPIVSGQLTDTTALVREVEVSTGSYNYHLWTGNPFTGLGDTKGVLKGDEKIALFRDEGGDFKYYFSKSDGSEVSETVRGLKLYCQGRENCKMENLNLIPNIKTYLKSMIVSADIADIANAPTVNEANIIAGLVDRVAGKLVTDKADELGKVIFEKPIPKIQN